MCGTTFDPAEASACSSCPLGADCSLACCPACGYSTVDAHRSTLARLARRLGSAARRSSPSARDEAPLSQAAPHTSVRVDGVDELPAWRQNQLAAYGLAPGRLVDVLQVSPLVVVRVEHVELALERRLAHGIRVTTLVQKGAR